MQTEDYFRNSETTKTKKFQDVHNFGGLYSIHTIGPYNECVQKKELP